MNNHDNPNSGFRTKPPVLTRRELARMAALLSIASLGSSVEAGIFETGSHMLSDHFDGEQFRNPGGQVPRTFLDGLRWKLNKGGTEWPREWPSSYPNDVPPVRVRTGLRTVLVGHSSFLVQGAGLNVLIDPVWSERASPLAFAGPRRKNAPGIVFDDLPPIDVVLVSHNHYDHLDQATLARLWDRDQPLIVAPLGNEGAIRGLRQAIRVRTADWHDAVPLGRQASVVIEPAVHWSARGVADRNVALWAAFTLKLGNHVIYFAGDTGFGDGMTFTQARQTHGRVDLALLPIGAYEPRWFMRDQHINPAEAVEAFGRLGAEAALGCHWGTFQLTDEGIEQPAKDLKSALVMAAIKPDRFVAARPGQVVTLL